MRPEPDPGEQERIPELHARQPQHKRRRRCKEQQEGYFVEIPVLDGSAVDKDVHAKFPCHLARDYIEVGCIDAAMMIQEESLPVRLNQTMPAIIAMAVE
jgi:hypothetical protein